MPKSCKTKHSILSMTLHNYKNTKLIVSLCFVDIFSFCDRVFNSLAHHRRSYDRFSACICHCHLCLCSGVQKKEAKTHVSSPKMNSSLLYILHKYTHPSVKRQIRYKCFKEVKYMIIDVTPSESIISS